MLAKFCAENLFFSGLFMYSWQQFVIYLKSVESDDLIYIHVVQWLPQSK